MGNKEDKKKQRQKYEDHGETIADMNVKGFSWYQREDIKRNRRELRSLGLTKSEKRAMLKGALSVYLPIYLIIIAAFGLTFLIIYLLIS